MYGYDSTISIVLPAAEKAASPELFQWVSTGLVPLLAFFGVGLTIYFNSRNLKKQRAHELDAKKIDRDTALRKELFLPVVNAIVEIQQSYALTLVGNYSQKRLEEMSRDIGKACAPIQLVAKPDTVVVLQTLIIDCAKQIIGEMDHNNAVADLKAKLASLQNGEIKRIKDIECATMILDRIPIISKKIADTIINSIPVLVAFRCELGIPTSIDEYMHVGKSNITAGEKMLNDIRLAQQEILFKNQFQK